LLLGRQADPHQRLPDLPACLDHQLPAKERHQFLDNPQALNRIYSAQR
jgi:hypothetical protein